MTAKNEPTSPAVTSEDIDALIEIFEASDWDELHLQVGDFEIFLSTDPAARLNAPVVSGAATAPASSIVPPATPASASDTVPAAPARNANEQGAEEPVPDSWQPIAAPNLGTFYRAAKPGAPPYVAEGQEVDADTEVCLIEVMKLFTALRAGVNGVIRRICVADGEMVEYGQVLFYIEPS